MYNVYRTNRYNKDFKHIVANKTLIGDLEHVIGLLSYDDKPLPAKFKDHQLQGNFVKFRECHIRPDWLLVYQKNKTELILLLVRTNTHSEIFG